MSIKPGQLHSFREARAFARRLKLKNVNEWVTYGKGEMPRLGRLPANIPATPQTIYADKGWKSWGDWLGTGAVAPRFREHRTFGEARAFARKLKLNSGAEWLAFCKGEIPRLGRLPQNIPANPRGTYAHKGWKSMGDWLGTGNIANRLKEYRSFRQARAFACKLKLKREHDWRAFCKGEMPRLGRLPQDIPANPNETYADKGWKGMGDWLGTGNVSNRLKRFRSFREARAFASQLKLNSSTEWFAFCKGEMSDKGRLPKDMPTAPSQAYANKGWAGFSDWLGTGRIRRAKGSRRRSGS